MDGEAEALAPPGRVMMMPGERPYVVLAEVGYLVQAGSALAFVVLLAVVRETGFANGWASALVTTPIALVLSAAWVQLGRRQEVSWFLVAGVFGGVSAILSLIGRLEPSPILIGSSISDAFSLAEAIVSLVYLAAQLLAFYTAAKAFQVRLFMYAAYLLIFGLFVPSAVSLTLVASTLMQPAVVETYSYLVYGISLLFSAATSLTAAAGFHRLRK